MRVKEWSFREIFSHSICVYLSKASLVPDKKVSFSLGGADKVIHLGGALDTSQVVAVGVLAS